MGESNEKEANPSAEQSAEQPTEPLAAPHEDAARLRDVARQFLQDDEVKDASREKKVEYLKEKGLSEADITTLLAEAEAPAGKSVPEPLKPQETQPQPEPPRLETRSQDAPPVITYPEFLAKPERPGPLVTGAAILNTLYACAGLTTLLYGTSKYAVAPMVESLTEARVDLHATTADKLSALNRLLESTVSEIPTTAGDYKDSDSVASTADDPTELFHRDIGTQTPFQPGASPLAPLGDPPAAASATEAPVRKLTSLTASIRELAESSTANSNVLSTVKVAVDVLNDDLSDLTYTGSPSDFVGGFSLYGSSSRKDEPEDEIKKARDNVRRVKGVLLSTRNFPTSTR